MKTEKKGPKEGKVALAAEVQAHLKKSDYFFLTNFERVTVSDVADLRKSLTPHGAEFHVVKNSMLGAATQSEALPSVQQWLVGHTAIVVGGKSPAEVAKVLLKFRKDKDRLVVKGGVLANKTIDANGIDALSKLPSFEILRSQLLALLNTPATQLVRVTQAIPQGVLNVLQAKAKKS